jgi:uncharacterized cupin superfamily protein
MKIPVMMEDVPSIEIEQGFEPINPNWVVAGQPRCRHKKLSSTADNASYVCLWEGTAGSFNWHYEKDEMIFVLSGEAWITDAEGRERHVGSGDYVFFPAGATCRFRVETYLRKIAILRETMSFPEAVALKALNKIKRVAFHPGDPAKVVRDSSGVEVTATQNAGATSLR